MSRIFSEYQHLVIYLSDVPDTVYELYFCTLCLHFRIKHLKECTGSKIAHLVRVAHDIDGFPKYAVPVFFIGLLCKGIIAQLVRPQIQLWIAAAVKQFCRKHKQHIQPKKDAPWPESLQIQFFFYSFCQFPIDVRKEK